MINEKVYKKLKDVASKKETISYSQLAIEMDFPYSTIDERNTFHHLLGDISIYEVKHKRPMLSVLVHHKGDIERTPGKGFFNLADELNQRKEGETDLQLKSRMIKECWNYWSKNQ